MLTFVCHSLSNSLQSIFVTFMNGQTLKSMISTNHGKRSSHSLKFMDILCTGVKNIISVPSPDAVQLRLQRIHFIRLTTKTLFIEQNGLKNSSSEAVIVKWYDFIVILVRCGYTTLTSCSLDVEILNVSRRRFLLSQRSPRSSSNGESNISNPSYVVNKSTASGPSQSYNPMCRIHTCRSLDIHISSMLG
jgi:hypothetical protein